MTRCLLLEGHARSTVYVWHIIWFQKPEITPYFKYSISYVILEVFGTFAGAFIGTHIIGNVAHNGDNIKTRRKLSMVYASSWVYSIWVFLELKYGMQYKILIYLNQKFCPAQSLYSWGATFLVRWLPPNFNN